MSRLFFLLLTFTSALLHAVDANYSFIRYNVVQGLSSDLVNVVYTDSRGFTWIGTSDGLNRFDGTRFVVYTNHRGDATSLPHNDIRSICEDQNGLLLIGTPSGICRFNPWSGKAEMLERNMPQGKDYPPCYGVYITPKGETWAWATGELWKLNPITNRFDFVQVTFADHKNLYGVHAVLEDRAGQFWIAMTEGLCRYDRVKGTAEKFSFTTDPRTSTIMNIFEDENGKLWCASWGGGVGLFDRATSTFTMWQWVTQTDNPSAVNIALTIQETKGSAGKIWVATNNGLLCWDKTKIPSADNAQFSVNDVKDANSISDNNLQTVHVNSAGQIWAGSSVGLSILLPEFQLFQSLAENYSGQTIRIVPENRDAFFICSWYGDGLQLFDTTGTALRKWPRVPADGIVENGQVSDACRDQQHHLWVATFGGLCKGDASGDAFTLLKHVDNDSTSICGQHINCVSCDSAGIIWAGSYGKGISRIDPASLQCTNYTVADDHLPSNLIWDVHVTRKNEIWFATDYGICHYDRPSGTFRSFTYALNGSDTIVMGVCVNICEDQNGDLWISSENGLFRQPVNGAMQVFTRDEGLPSNSVSAVTSDSKGNLWIATANGLAHYDYSSGTFRNYSRNNGLPSASLSGDLYSVSGSKIIMGLHSTMLAFNPQRLSPPAVVPRIFITAVSIGNTNLEFTADPSLSPTHELTWNENNVSIEFTATGLTGGSPVQYSYRLLGSGDVWISSGKTQTASFAALAPGSYTFECRAAYGNETWSNPVVFSFIITPPFWKTWWFIVLCSGTVITLLVIIVRREAVRKMKLRLLVLEREKAVQHERDRISRDMHDDLGSGLTKIAILSEVVRKNLQSTGSVKHIDTISESARNLVDNLNDIVWGLNPDNDNFASLGAYIREYAGKYLEPFPIQLNCVIPDSLPPISLTEEQKRYLFLVVKESLNNIVKHAGATQVTIRVNCNGSQLEVEVTDNGNGFEISEARPLGNGLRNIRKRVESIGGECSITSEIGAGTSIHIRIPFT